MTDNEEKVESRKEYTAPQMEVVDCSVQNFLCDSGPESIDFCIGDCPGE